MSASSKMPKGLKDSEYEKGHLGNRPPVLYVPPTDLLQTKDSSETLKVKLADGTFFSMSIFAKGSPEDYLQHIIAVLRLVDQKGLHVLCKKHAKEMKNANLALRAIKRKSVGPKESGAKEKDQEDLETEEKLTQELLSTAHQQYNKAIGATYKLLRNLLAGEPQTQWDCIVREMHERDSWAGADGEKHDGKRPKGFNAFLDCLELHKLTWRLPFHEKGLQKNIPVVKRAVPQSWGTSGTFVTDKVGNIVIAFVDYSSRNGHC
jgi:hypothetical protein